MSALIWLGIGLGALFLALFLLGAFLTKRRIVRKFEKNNVLVFGAKGKGKDLLFQAVINARKKPYYANQSYGGKFHPFECQSFDMKNTYENFIRGEINVLNKEDYPLEGMDVYLSDAGIIMPSQYDGLLNKQFPSFPVAFALSRQLWANNFHCNTQAFSRLWIKLREQADYFVKCVGVRSFGPVLAVKVITYDKLQSAEAGLLPYEKGMINVNKVDKALVNQYQASNGEIKTGWVLLRKRSVHYDTRAFHKTLFGVPAPQKESPFVRLKRWWQQRKSVKGQGVSRDAVGQPLTDDSEE